MSAGSDCRREQVSWRIQQWRGVTPARASTRARGSFAGPNAIPASGKEAGIRGRRDFRVARLHDGDVAEGGAEAESV